MPDPIATIEAMQAVYLGESVRAVMHERVEQITKHDYDAEHDDEHEKKQIAGAAAAFLVSYIEDDVATGFGNFWPWCPTEGVVGAPGKAEDKTDYELLAVAGALILAEMDRIDRIAMTTRHDTED